jgi:hypothetical protein
LVAKLNWVVLLSDFLQVNFPFCRTWKVWFQSFQRTHQISRKKKIQTARFWWQAPLSSQEYYGRILLVRPVFQYII